METLIPKWIRQGEWELVNYYPYPSSTRFKIFEFDMSKPKNYSPADGAFFYNIKSDLFENYLINDSKPNIDNKMVIEIKIDTCSLYVGFYDNMCSIGMSVHQRDGREPYPLTFNSVNFR
jgi:hypothetical protein